MDPKVALYPKGSFAAGFISAAGVIGVCVTILSIAIAVFVVWPPPAHPNAQAWLFAMAGLWGVGGPMWFFSEYFFFYRRSGEQGTWDQFKHGQQVSAAIWAGLSVSLAALGSSDLAKPESARLLCELQTVSAAASAPQGGLVVLAGCRKAP